MVNFVPGILFACKVSDVNMPPLARLLDPPDSELPKRAVENPC